MVLRPGDKQESLMDGNYSSTHVNDNQSEILRTRVRFPALPLKINMNETNTWKSMPCGVPGYDMSALEYANGIKQHTIKGRLTLALTWLLAAQQANVLHRIEFAMRD